ncbi:hypothetical protein GCM10010329_48980 [Streptomyces spiroverticillatus]|uniref:Uncharacterized protein n=1 Tax=Streptomyces finlayi TaxID=67296 RepID=A0A918X173_9ACTN|nr:DUF6247 family protein [Streptomyces finlayi]GHA20037.1 hypothetical protein GCM10010329_48980 [Streptomyces spiroverticillatus]GHD02867.1 hypothetical protein GCM10010334_49930 [Streptomyces finlayi]
MTAQRTPSPRTQPATDTLLPRPDRTTAALRAAVARLAPARLPEMERQMEEALSLAARTGSLSPLTAFLESWAVAMEIARVPSSADRLREAEYAARSAAPGSPEWRSAMEAIGAVQGEARRALAEG